MQEVRAAVIGTGVMGRKYAQMIAEGKAGALRLTAVVCRSAGAQQWAKDTLPDTVRVCPSADQLYDYAEEFDAVLVVTPHQDPPGAGDAGFCPRQARLVRQAQRKRAGTGTGNEPRRRKKRPCFRHDVPSAPLQKVYAA